MILVQTLITIARMYYKATTFHVNRHCKSSLRLNICSNETHTSVGINEATNKEYELRKEKEIFENFLMLILKEQQFSFLIMKQVPLWFV